MLANALFVVAALAASALATDSATVVLQKGSGSSATNTTVSIDINTIYSDASNLSGLSALYITDAGGIPIASLICTPFQKTDGTIPAAAQFTFTKPTVLTGSESGELAAIVCISTYVPHHPGAHHTSSSMATGTRAATATGASASPASSTGNAASSLYLPGELFGGLALAGFGVAFAL